MPHFSSFSKLKTLMLGLAIALPVTQAMAEVQDFSNDLTISEVVENSVWLGNTLPDNISMGNITSNNASTSVSEPIAFNAYTNNPADPIKVTISSQNKDISPGFLSHEGKSNPSSSERVGIKFAVSNCKGEDEVDLTANNNFTGMLKNSSIDQCEAGGVVQNNGKLTIEREALSSTANHYKAGEYTNTIVVEVTPSA